MCSLPQTGLATDRHIIALGTEKFLVRCSTECSRIIAIHEHAVIVVAETGIVRAVKCGRSRNRIGKRVLTVIDILHHESLVTRGAQGNLPVFRGMVEVALHQFAFLRIFGDVGERVPFTIDSDESTLEDIDHVFELIPNRRKLLDMALYPFEFRLLHRPFVVP